MKNSVSISRAQAHLPEVLRMAADGFIRIKNRGKTVAFVVSPEKLERTLETLEILSNPNAMKALLCARRRKAKYYPLESLDEK